MPEIGTNKKHAHDIATATMTVIRITNRKGDKEDPWPKT